MSIRHASKSLLLAPIAFTLFIGLGAILYGAVNGPAVMGGNLEVVIEPGL